MTTDVAIYSASVPDRMRYAEALSGASLLPESYRGKPANLLLALEYGAALGIAPMVAVQEIHVIKGKPTLSALLRAALVRRAGHTLRVTGDATTATCDIIRADDPDFTFTTTWTLDRARAAGLLSNDSWRKYPDNMLKARAISECARNACPDVIAGFGYTAEELGDDTADSYPTSSDGVSAHNAGHGSAEIAAPGPSEEPVIVYAEIVEPDPPTRPVERLSTTPDDDAWQSAPVASPATTTAGDVAASPAQAEVARRSRLNEPDGAPTPAQLKMLGALLRGQTREQALAVVSSIVGRDVESRNDLTKAETSLVLDALKAAS
jgi:hypothetical protein